MNELNPPVTVAAQKPLLFDGFDKWYAQFPAEDSEPVRARMRYAYVSAETASESTITLLKEANADISKRLAATLLELARVQRELEASRQPKDA